MKNNWDFISPGEINKFVYCPYQWYYEKIYGAGQIRKLYNERNKELGFEDRTKSNFNKGLNFHRKYQAKDKLAKALKKLAIAVLLAALAFLLYKLLYYNGAGVWITIFTRH